LDKILVRAMKVNGDVIARPRTLALWLLFGINVVNFFDRQILAAVTEPLRHEWALTDTQLGWLIAAFTLLYAAVGLPLGRLADVWKRNHLLSVGLTLWSGLTCLSGFCRSFWLLFAARLGVGVGEASCAPAASSLIGDLYRPHERARAMSIFMLGLPAGVSLSYFVGGWVAQRYGWRPVFYLAGIPGLLLAGAALLLREPPRGRSEAAEVGAVRRPGSPAKLVLGIPTMRWIIASGLLHNFIMYALTFFLPSFLVRYHRTTVQTAGQVSALVVGTVGALGMLAGGWLGDAAKIRRQNGRMLVASTAVFLAAPAGFFAHLLPAGALPAFILLQGIAAFLMYVYYATVYATIHDIVEPALRGRAMAIYFFAMYLLGGSMGPVATGRLSDFFARRAAGVMPITEIFRATGLHQAMYVISALPLVLAAVLWAGAGTASRDIRDLDEWMTREISSRTPRRAQRNEEHE
jgi:MFS family permease